MLVSSLYFIAIKQTVKLVLRKESTKNEVYLRVKFFYSMFVDKKYETIMLPVLGLSVPYHISTIKVKKNFFIKHSLTIL